MCSTSMCTIQINKVGLKLTTYYMLKPPANSRLVWDQFEVVNQSTKASLRMWLGEDICKLIFRENREQLESIMDKMITDTLSVINSSNRNGNSWFVVLIASLNIMAKTFAKIAKTFVELSVMIVAIKWRSVNILHLEAKNAQMNYKIKSTQKNG